MTSPAVSNLFNQNVGSSAEVKQKDRSSDEPAATAFNWRVQLFVGISVLAYLLLGGLMFQFLELPNEMSSTDGIRAAFRQFLDQNPSVDSKNLTALLAQIGKAFSSGFTLGDNDTLIAPPSKWDYAGSVFFCLTVVTTIGYGNLAPATQAGQSICCLYALIGIPMLAVFLSGIADRVKAVQVRCHLLACWRRRGRIPIAATSILYGLLGLLMFFIVPAAVFTATEGWSFGLGMYYSMITLATIGFGDYVAGQTYKSDVYRFCLVCWIFLGMVYVSGLIHAVQVTMEKGTQAVQIKGLTMHVHDQGQGHEEMDEGTDIFDTSQISNQEIVHTDAVCELCKAEALKCGNPSAVSSEENRPTDADG